MITTTENFIMTYNIINMNPQILLFILLPFLGVSQSLHQGLKDTPDMSQSVRKIECIKYSTKTETVTQCDCYIYNNGIVIRKNSTIHEFTRVNDNVYRDNKDKLVELVQDKNYYILKSTNQTWYLIKK